MLFGHFTQPKCSLDKSFAYNLTPAKMWGFFSCFLFFPLWHLAVLLLSWNTGLTFLRNCHTVETWEEKYKRLYCQYLVYGALLTQAVWQNMLQQTLHHHHHPLHPTAPPTSKVLSFISMACLPLCCMCYHASRQGCFSVLQQKQHQGKVSIYVMKKVETGDDLVPLGK